MAYPGYNMSDIYGQVPVRRQRQMGGLLPPGWPNEDLAGPFATSYSPAREFYSDVAGTVGRGLLDPDFWSGAGKEATLGLLGLPADLAVFGAGVAPAMIDNWAEGRPLMENTATLSDYPLTSDSLARDFGIPFKGTGPENAGRVVGGIFDLTNLPRAARMARGLFEPRSGVGAGGAIPEMIGAQPIARGMRGMVAYQGSPHKFDALDPSKIGTGQGAQSYGHGLYVAENKGVGQWYADELGSFDRVTGGADTAPSIATNLADELGDGLFDVLDSLRASKYTDDDGIHHVMDDGSEIIEIGNQGAWDALSAPLNKYLYEIEVPDADIAKMLDWDKPLSEQSQSVRDALKTAGFEYDPSVQARLDEINDLTESMAKDRLPDNRMRQEAEWHALKREADELGRRLSMSNPTGEQMYKSMATDKFGKVAEILRDDEAAFASEYLNNLGIPGIKYYDQGSRAAGEGTRNMVLFDDLARRAKVLKRNDEIIEQPSVDEFVGKLLDDELPLDEASRMGRTIYAGTYGAPQQQIAPYGDLFLPGGVGGDNRFGGIFGSTDRAVALSHGDTLQEFTPANMIGDADFRKSVLYDDGHDAAKNHVRDIYQQHKGQSLSDDEVDELLYYISGDKSVYDSPQRFGEITGIDVNDTDALSEAAWDLQGVKGEVARRMGYDAVGIVDEHGESVLVLSNPLPKNIEQPSVNRGNFRQGGAVDPSGDMGPTGGILGDLHAAGTARFALDPRQMSLDEAREGVVAHAGDYSSPITVKPEDAATTLRRRVQGYDPESGAGAPKTPHGVLRAEGQPDFRIGEPTTDEWINEIETTLGAEGITEARRWYEDFSKLYHKLYPNDPERAMREMIASLAANQSKSPAGAALDANRASESLRNFRHTKKFGMSGDKILALLRGDTTGMGIGLKLSDFADSTKGLNVRNATGYSPEGGAPFVADIHSGRDMGLVDWPMYNFLREKYGQKQLDDMGVTLDTSISTDANKKYFDAIAEELEGAEGGLLAKQFAREYNLGKPAMGDVERMFENVEGKGLLGNRELPAWKKEAINEGAVRPTGTFWGDPQYEHAAELGRRIADDLNERGYMGGNWTPAQVQAAGWVKMGKVTDRAPETADAVVAGNTQTMRFESAFGETSPYAAKYPEIADMTTPEREAFTRETGDVVRDMLREELGIAELPPIFGTGTWFDTANPAVNLPIFSSPEAAKVATDAIGYMLQQDSVMGLRYVNSGPDVAMQMRSTDGNWLNSEQTGAFWDALQVNLKSAPVEVRKKISLILAGQSPIDNGMEIVFTKLKGYSANAIHKAFEEQLMPVMEKTLKELGHDGDFEFDIAHAESYFTGNNWSAKANGEDYFQRMEAARPGTGRAIQNNWQPKIEAIIKKHAGQKAKAKQGATKQVGGVVRKAP